jgi:transposase-like protein
MATADKDPPSIECPHCGASVTLVTKIAKFGSRPELQTYRCSFCRLTETYVVNRTAAA